MKAEILTQLDALISEGNRLESSMKYDMGSTSSEISETDFRTFAVNSAAAIDRVAGQQSQYFKMLPHDNMTGPLSVPGFGTSPASVITGSLNALRHAVDNDLLVSLEDRLRATIHDDLLQQAKVLLASKYHVAAMVLTGGVLENHLRKLCVNRSLTWKGDGSISKYNDLLKDCCYLQSVWRRIQQIGDIRNDAAHINQSKVKEADVEDAIQYVERLIVDQPA